MPRLASKTLYWTVSLLCELLHRFNHYYLLKDVSIQFVDSGNVEVDEISSELEICVELIGLIERRVHFDVQTLNFLDTAIPGMLYKSSFKQLLLQSFLQMLITLILRCLVLFHLIIRRCLSVSS